MIDLISFNDYRDQFNISQFKKEHLEFLTLLIEFSIENKIIWKQEPCSDFFRVETVIVDNTITIDFNNDETYYDYLIDAWIDPDPETLDNDVKTRRISTICEFKNFLERIL